MKTGIKFEKHAKGAIAFLVLFLLYSARCPGEGEGAGGNESATYQKGLLEKVEGREKYATEEGIKGSQYNPDSKGLMESKEKERISDMGYEREHEFDHEGFGGYDGEIGGREPSY